MIDLRNSQEVKSLMDAMAYSWRAMKPFRQARRDLVESYVGSEYPIFRNGKVKRPTYVNNLAKVVEIWMVSLASTRPQVSVSSVDPTLYPFAKRFEVAVNNLLDEIDFRSTLRRVILDAFFGMGVVKIYWADSEPIEIENPEWPMEPPMSAGVDAYQRWQKQCQEMSQTILVDPGKPFCEAISLDDYVFDMSAASIDKARYHGHIYRVPLSAAKSDARFDPVVVEKLKPSHRYNHESMFDRDEQTRDMSGEDMDAADVEPMVLLMDLYLPFEKQWAVMIPGEPTPLFVADWDGPEAGPYRHLFMSAVPDNPMPVSPASMLIHLDKLANSLFRKTADQARRQKDVTAYSGDERDALAVKNAQDGELVAMRSPDSINLLKYGGPDQMNQAFYQVASGEFSRMAGNLDSRAGLGPSAPTAKQDAMISQAVSRAEAASQMAVSEFVAAVARDLGSMLWIDERYETEGTRTEPGIDMPLRERWTPEDREGDFVQYKFDVTPFSAAFVSPNDKMQKLTQVLTILAPLVQMSGGVIDGSRVAEMFSDLAQLPELKQLVSFPMPGSMPGQVPGDPSNGGGGVGQLSLNQPREYIRTSRSQQTPDTQRTMMAQQFAAASSDNRNNSSSTRRI